VVKEEIRVNVINRPYGGFPWLHLPAALFETYANAHDGYGSFGDLETATVQDARRFFDRYYAPANALLCVCGGFDPDEALTLVTKYFGGIGYRPAPPRPDVSEPDLTQERRVVRLDRHAPAPALAAGWRLPDPVGAWSEYLAYLVLSKVMSGGGASRLERRLVLQDRAAAQQRCYLGLLSNPYDVRDPTALVVQVRQTPHTPADRVLDAIAEESDQVAENGLRPGELRRAVIQTITALLAESDTILQRTTLLANLELQHGRAELLSELPCLLRAVTENQVRAAAATLTPDRRAVVELRPAAEAQRGLAA
jgi:zinc protease